MIARLTGRPLLGFGAGALFALHPVHAEAVSWISGRSELLFTASGAAAWWLHLRARDGGRLTVSIGAWSLLVLSLGSKETAVCWPLLFAAGDGLFPRRRAADDAEEATRAARPAPFRAWSLYSGYAACVLLWIVARYLALGQLGRRPEEGAHLLNPLEGEPWWPAAPLTFLRVLGIGLRLIALPGREGCIDYGFNQIPLVKNLFQADLLVVLAGLVGFGFWAAWSLRAHRASEASRTLLLAAALLLLPWLPASSLLLPSVSILAERNLYLPSLGVCLAAAALYEQLRGRFERLKIWTLSGAVLLLALMGSASFARDAAFLDPVDLFASTAANCPSSARGHFLLGAALMDRGLSERAGAQYEAALEIAPGYVDARADLAQALARLGRRQEARAAARIAFEASARSIETRLSVLSAVAAAGLEAEEASIHDSMKRESASDARVLFIEAQLDRSAGRLEEARAGFEEMKTRFPRNPAGSNGIGAVLMAGGDTEGARRAFEEALAIDPYDGSALYNLGLLSLGTMGENPGAAGEAVRRFARYVRVMPDDPLGWMRLGEAEEKAGQLAAAEASIRRAVAVAPGNPAPAKSLDSFLGRHRLKE